MKPIYVTPTSNGWKIQFEYNARLVDVVRRIPNHPRYISDERAWFVKDDNVNMPEGRDAQWYVEAFANWAVGQRLCTSKIIRKAESDDISELPPMPKLTQDVGLLLEPRDYQAEGIAYAMQTKRCIFGDQPGLGKTMQAIGAVNGLNAYPALVVCPNALKVNWMREFKKFAGVNAVILNNDNITTWPTFYHTKTLKGEPMAKVFITNYESLRKFFVAKIKETSKFTTKSILLKPDVSIFASVIIDESHRCKSSKTQQSKILECICNQKNVVFELTGTPFVNCNTDFIQQLKILGRLEDFGGYKNFVHRYCDGPKQTSNSRALNYYLRKTCFFRRLKKDVLTQLPPKSRQYITCDITNRDEYRLAERNLIDYLIKVKHADDESIQRTLRGEVMTKMGILKQISAKGKIREFCSFVHDIVDGGEKLIVFAYLHEVIDAIHREFKGSVTVTGNDSVEQKQWAVDQFQNNKDCKVIILNYRSGGVGLTLTAASRVAFIEFPWTYADCEQAEDRAHRIGQVNSVDCYYFLGNDTIDKYMYDVIQRKKAGANEATGTDEQTEENIVNICMDLFKDKIQ